MKSFFHWLRQRKNTSRGERVRAFGPRTNGAQPLHFSELLSRSEKSASKPVSRVLFSTAIYLGAPLPARSSHLPGETGPVMFPSTVLLRIEFTAPDTSEPAGELLPHLSTLTRPEKRNGRDLSVALVLKSPSAGVTRYSCPVEPGLSSQTAFRRICAAVRLACTYILLNSLCLVNHTAGKNARRTEGSVGRFSQ